MVIDNRGKTPPISNLGYELLEVNSLGNSSVTPIYKNVSKFVNELVYKNWFRQHIDKDDILMSTVGSVGNVAILKEARGCIAQNIIGLRIKQKFSSMYVYYLLSSHCIQKRIKQLQMDAVQPSLKVPHFLSIPIKNIPDLLTQKRIAKILSTVDGQIEKTDAIIAKYQAIKQGMLHDLFTRGIDLATGKLRPTPEQAPELYKSSPLGLIPKDWDVDKLATCCNSNGTYGINAAAVDYSNELPTYLRITDISENGKFINVDKKSVNHSLSSNYILSSGDIVFARTGASVGKTYLYNPDDGELIYAGFLIKFSPNIEKILPKFLKLITELSYYQNWVIKASMRSGQPGINGQEYGGFEIQLPNIEEQALICTKIDSLENLYNSESKKLTKLQKIKHGLMSKLLNGDV